MATKNRIRKKEIRVLVTEAELQIAKDKAALCDMNMSEFFRNAIYNTEIKITKFSFDEVSEFSKAINANSFEINKIGNNINQLVKAIHENNDMYSKTQIEYALRDLENVRVEYEKLCDIMMNKLYGLE